MQHSSLVLSTVTSQQKGLGLISVWSSHVLPVLVLVYSGFSGFLSQSNNMYTRLISDSKLTIGIPPLRDRPPQALIRGLHTASFRHLHWRIYTAHIKWPNSNFPSNVAQIVFNLWQCMQAIFRFMPYSIVVINRIWIEYVH